MTLEVRNLSVVYRTPEGPLRALREIDFSISKGEIVGVVGESGCGKSTLAATVIRLLPAEAEIVDGCVSLEGEDVLRLPESAMRHIRGERISIVFQNPKESLHPLLTIGTQMVDIQHRSSDRVVDKRRRAAEMLTRVGIGDADRRLGQYVHQLSGGTLQRIALAMAILSCPSLLIADEPTAAVDSGVESQLLGLLEEFRAEKQSSIMFISHDLGIVGHVCDSVAVMYAGQVVERGSVETVFENPRHPYTRLLLACDPTQVERGVGSLPTIPGELPKLVEIGIGCSFEPRCPDAIHRCRVEDPNLRTDPNGSVRCHRAQEVS